MAEITKKEILRVFNLQKQNHNKIRLANYKQRKTKLKKLLTAVYSRTLEIEEALYKDFKKAAPEVKLTEIYLLVREIKHTVRHLKEWMEPEQVYPPLTLLGSKNRIIIEPKGIVLIISSWNYPFLLTLNPLVSAIAAGNCAIVKPSSKAPHTSALIKSILSEIFAENEVAVFEGGGKTAGILLEQKFDHIFFTGGIEVGKSVMKSAAENLIPITLELGGKSPAIIDAGANMHEAAQNIVWGKFLNAGQTCVAPDYVMVHQDDEELLLKQLEKSIRKLYGEDISRDNNPDYCDIIDAKHTERINQLVKDAVKKGAIIKIGNETNNKNNFIAPLVLTGIKPDMQLFKEEIFGPVLPIVTYKNSDDIYKTISLNQSPLAMYIFSSRKEFIKKMSNTLKAGGITINGIAAHFVNSNLPFGGVNNSGIGKYHGYHGFKTFSNEKAFMKLPKYHSLKLLYPPYNNRVKKIIDFAVKYL